MRAEYTQGSAMRHGASLRSYEPAAHVHACTRYARGFLHFQLQPIGNMVVTGHRPINQLQLLCTNPKNNI